MTLPPDQRIRTHAALRKAVSRARTAAALLEQPGSGFGSLTEKRTHAQLLEQLAEFAEYVTKTGERHP